MRCLPAALALAAISLCAACERVSGLSGLEFECFPEPLETTCAGLACGAATNNCGAEVECPDTCAPPFTCEAGGVPPNTCGCTGGQRSTPAAPEGCTAFAGATGNTYYVCGLDQGFVGARDFCRAIDTDLVVIADLAENTLVRSRIDRHIFLGLRDEDCGAGACTFEWVDGSPLTFARWNAGEPNNTGGGEHCAEMLDADGFWNDVSCDNSLGVACETTCPAGTP